MYSIDLIALDLDGTLVDYDGNVSPENRRAVLDAVNAGIRVALVTGRGADLPARLVRELRLNVPSICAHGALTKDFLSGRTIGHIPVPLQYAVALLEYAERRGFDAAVYSEERFLRAHGAPLHMDDMRLPHWHAVTSLREAVATPPTFLRFFGREAVAEICSTFAHLPLHFKHEVFGDLEECAVTSADATKEIALARLCADLRNSARTRSRHRRFAQRRADVALGRYRRRHGQRAAGDPARSRPCHGYLQQRRSRRGHPALRLAWRFERIERVIVRVVGFARARELLGNRGQVSVADGGSIADAWEQLVSAIPELSELSASVRFAVDGALTGAGYGLREGQELAILPPVGGG